MTTSTAFYLLSWFHSLTPLRNQSNLWKCKSNISLLCIQFLHVLVTLSSLTTRHVPLSGLLCLLVSLPEKLFWYWKCFLFIEVIPPYLMLSLFHHFLFHHSVFVINLTTFQNYLLIYPPNTHMNISSMRTETLFVFSPSLIPHCPAKFLGHARFSLYIW